MKRKRRLFFAGVGSLAAFALWTVLVCFVDVRAIGPEGSSVGFALLNGYFHNLTGVNMSLYTITDWLGLLPICVALAFFILGLVQWIMRKGFLKVDRSILTLGVFYIVVMAVYILFEVIVINYRPVLIDGRLEASFPSSTTMLVMCVMPTAIMQLHAFIKSKPFRRCVIVVTVFFIVFMVVGRLISGVHWITDIIGGTLFSTGIVLVYSSINITEEQSFGTCRENTYTP